MMAIMYDPTQDDDKLIADFLAAYYGELAAPWIRLYMVRTGQRRLFPLFIGLPKLKLMKLTCVTTHDTCRDVVRR